MEWRYVQRKRGTLVTGILISIFNQQVLSKPQTMRYLLLIAL